MSKWNEWKEALGDSRPWHLIDSGKRLNDQEIIKKRLDECLSCENLIKVTKSCKLCGCIMPLKTTLADAECPIGKWKREPLN